MATTVDEDAVRTLLQCAETTDLSVFVQQGQLIADELLGSSALSSTRQNLIATYLAAHIYTISMERGALSSTGMGEAVDKFHNTYTRGFGMTRFGQQAIALDSSGILAQESAKAEQTTVRKAEFRVV